MIHRIHGYFGGLGDNLQFSTLPERFVELGNEVHTLASGQYRNPEIKRLVWGNNPYITGNSDGDWTLGDVGGFRYENKYNDYIKNIEAGFGLEPKNSYPKVYFTPRPIGVDGIIDISSITIKYNIDSVLEKIFDLLRDQYDGMHFSFLRSKYSNDNTNVSSCKVTYAYSLEDYANVIYNSKVYISLLSGGHMLAASMRHLGATFKQYCFIPETDYKAPVIRGPNLYDWSIENMFHILPEVEYRRC